MQREPASRTTLRRHLPVQACAFLLAVALPALSGHVLAQGPGPGAPGGAAVAQGAATDSTANATASSPAAAALAEIAPPPVTGSKEHPVASWGKPLPYPIVIADRRNNRLLEVAPDKHVIWHFDSPNHDIYHDNDDVYFSPDGRLLAISEEDNQDIHLIDYYARELIWSYGVPDQPGPADGQLNFPDDTHLLRDGSILVADIRNCRVLFIDRESAKVKVQWGGLESKDGLWKHTHRIGDKTVLKVDPACRHDPPQAFGLPNGVVELDNGDILVSEIIDAWITRITRSGTVVWARQAPGGVRYPSDAMPTRDGQVIVADYSRPGRVVIFDPRTGNVTWSYFEKSGEGMLDHPSLAMEMPNGDVLLNDDYRHRVVVIDRDTRKIIWQYGQTDHKGKGPGQLNNPDGVDVDVFRDWKAALGAAPR